MKALSGIACLALLCCAQAVQAKTHVLFTVDVESYTDGDPAKQIWGEVGNDRARWGITRLMDVFEAAGVRATFYLNVYELAQHGVEPIRSAAEEIDRRGHDLELHTHPASMFPVAGMAQAGPAGQEDVLRRGIELIRQWTGRTVIAHRAGGYRANADTLAAEKRVGLRVDASFSYLPMPRYPQADRAPPGNVVRRRDGVIRLPVTYYNQVRLGGWSSPRLVDIEGSTEAELKTILDQAAEAGLCTVNVMLHSFSLSRYGRPDPDVAERLANVIAYVKKDPRLDIVTTAGLYRRMVAHDVCASESAFVPTTGLVLTLARAVEDFDKGWKNKLVVSATGLVLLLVPFVAVLLLRQVYSQRRTRDLYSR